MLGFYLIVYSRICLRSKKHNLCGDLEFVGEGGEGKHISLAAIFEGKHISLVICVWGHTYHGEIHITVTPAFFNTSISLFFLMTFYILHS